MPPCLITRGNNLQNAAKSQPLDYCRHQKPKSSKRLPDFNSLRNTNSYCYERRLHSCKTRVLLDCHQVWSNEPERCIAFQHLLFAWQAVSSFNKQQKTNRTSHESAINYLSFSSRCFWKLLKSMTQVTNTYGNRYVDISQLLHHNNKLLGGCILSTNTFNWTGFACNVVLRWFIDTQRNLQEIIPQF